MAAGDTKVNATTGVNADEDERPNDEEYQELENRSELGDEDLTEAEMEALRRELAAEISELEWEFRQAKETLYNERIAQVESKLAQARSGSAPEFLHVASLVEETYRIRHQVAKCRRDFAIEVADKELDNELQIAQCNTTERLLTTEDQLRLRLQESLCKLQVERATMALQSHNQHNSQRRTRSSENDSNGNLESQPRGILSALDTNFYLPAPNLEPRKKPVSLSPTAPRLIYQLPEEDIRADVDAIMAAVKEHKLAVAMAEMNGGKRVC
ncbi:Sds3-like protein [Opisthorchis viverrini]|uniref:Sds3-like protein n=2 Tax=Opisthorchis viverrini TaxID=6198 RepID=A0A1S8X514_OPIVI|nr:hypothetical protein T265_04914 [Opisthorchis viverrini]KER28241.1 hypothetical protein T265_04914 [Opisthorchis viverrini]OON21553.1 Sds3-like protein [Opisthorchis viverrini]